MINNIYVCNISHSELAGCVIIAFQNAFISMQYKFANYLVVSARG